MQAALHLFIWVSALGTAIVIPLTVRKSRFALVVWLGLYILGYVALSAGGRYVPKRGDPLRSHWMPQNCERPVSVLQGREQIELNALGAFYLPLVGLDRLVIHRVQGGTSRAPQFVAQ